MKIELVPSSQVNSLKALLGENEKSLEWGGFTFLFPPPGMPFPILLLGQLLLITQDLVQDESLFWTPCGALSVHFSALSTVGFNCLPSYTGNFWRLATFSCQSWPQGSEHGLSAKLVSSPPLHLPVLPFLSDTLDSALPYPPSWCPA